MRQAGIVAAAGIIALEQMSERLAQDHANARKLAEGIYKIESLSIDPSEVQTNIVYFTLTTKRITGKQLLTRLEEMGVKTLMTGPDTFRMVTHYGIEESDIDDALSAMRAVFE